MVLLTNHSGGIMFYDIIHRIQSNNGEETKNDVLFMIKKFYPMIKKYSRRLNYYCSDTDMVIYRLTI